VLNVVLPAAAAVATIGHHDGAGAKQLAVSLGVTWGLTFVLKRATNETRPNGGNYSFPSGHSSSSFASAEFMRRRYGWKWGAPAYAAAAFVAYSRVESRMHYTHDVIAGAAIGVASSFIFTKPHKNWTATVSGDTRGAQFTFTRVW
jgi:membrane-associated phospholipid phosphatase